MSGNCKLKRSKKIKDGEKMPDDIS
jgi:hypothetical protein